MFVDAHAHLDKYGDLLDEALQQIQQHRIFTIATAMDLPSYFQLQQIAERSDLVLPTFGVHPRRAPEYADRLDELSPFIEQSPAIGEIGLDFHWVEDSSQYPAQLKVLEYFFAAAREQKKMVNLHTKARRKTSWISWISMISSERSFTGTQARWIFCALWRNSALTSPSALKSSTPTPSGRSRKKSRITYSLQRQTTPADSNGSRALSVCRRKSKK